MDLKKYTDEYIANTPAEQLNAERKQLIRHARTCQEITAKMRGRLAAEGEEQHVLDELGRMPEVRRNALERVLARGKTTGSGTVR